MSTVLNPESPPLRNKSTAAYSDRLVVKDAKGKLYGFTVYNSGAAQFIQIHDAAAQPSDTAVPLMVFAVAATANLAIDFGVHGLQCVNGIVISNSSTGPTLTNGANDCFISAQFI